MWCRSIRRKRYRVGAVPGTLAAACFRSPQTQIKSRGRRRPSCEGMGIAHVFKGRCHTWVCVVRPMVARVPISRVARDTQVCAGYTEVRARRRDGIAPLARACMDRRESRRKTPPPRAGEPMRGAWKEGRGSERRKRGASRYEARSGQARGARVACPLRRRSSRSGCVRARSPASGTAGRDRPASPARTARRPRAPRRARAR